MNIRPIKSKEELFALWEMVISELNLQTNHPRNYNSYLKVFCTHPDLILCAEINNEFVGAIMGVNQGKNEVLLGELVVKSDYRKQGIGKKLLQAFEKSVCKIGKKEILLGAREDTEVFYSRQGYLPRLFVQNIKNERKFKEFVLNIKSRNHIIWEQKATTYKAIIKTKSIDKKFEKEIRDHFECDTQYLFYKRVS